MTTATIAFDLGSSFAVLPHEKLGMNLTDFTSMMKLHWLTNTIDGTDLVIPDIFKAVDTNHDGYLDYYELNPTDIPEGDMTIRGCGP
ncbi:hypothetical protein HDU81_009958 [Chytriomyces hyalinus]|nr:hypothetical protein HDU81_009958 [Chytriomyces hyalinus]